jgi:oxygen-independent coproporphyrinogen-3 oxidase
MPSIASVSPRLIARSATAGQPDPFLGRGDVVTGEQYALALHSRGSNNRQAAVSIYIHLPFCPSRCLSCDHNTTVTHDSAEIDRYLDALEREMVMVTQRIGRGHDLLQLHLGGGTPNYLSDPQLVRLVDMIESHFRIVDTTETSLEASPKRTSFSQLALLHGLGFRRINFEVRDLDPDVQMALGRSHSLPVLHDVFDSARQVGFETVSMDLVYGLPNQSLASIRRTLRKVVELSPDRIACFSYSRRPGTFAHQRAIDINTMPSLADKMAMFNSIVEVLEADSYSWVGLDCFARNDDSLLLAQLQHRLHRNWIGYTLHDNADLYGFGTNAVSELDSLCVQNHLLIPDWLQAMRAGSLPIRGGIHLSAADRERRNAMTDLMCNMELRDYAALISADNENCTLNQLHQDGLVDVRADRVSVTDHGRHMLHQLWGDASPIYRWSGAW